MESTLTFPRTAQAAASATVATASRRWVALDLFRFLAVILMVQGHTFNVLVEESLRDAVAYRWHNYIHGYTAPMFLFAAGLAFGITTFRRWEEHLTTGKAFWKRIERYGLLLAIGYMLHVPGFSFQSLATASEHQWRTFFKVDALQEIGITLLACELLVMALRTRRRFVAVVATLGTAAVFLAPWVGRLTVEEWLPQGIAAYINQNTGSLFPLFPWSGFIFAGLLTAYWVYRARQHLEWHQLGVPLVTGAGVLLLGSILLTESDPGIFGEHNFWKASPWFFLWRVGCVLLVLAGLAGLAKLLTRRPPGPALQTVQVMGQETLVIYVAHLLVLYGTPLHRGFHVMWGKELSIPMALAIFIGVFVAMAGLAWGWNLFKTRRPAEFHYFRLGLLAVVVGYMLVG